MSKCLIFGGAGFIASSLINLLLKEDREVIAFDNNFKNTADTLIPFIRDGRFKFIMGDVTEVDDVKRAYECDPDYVFAGCALVGAPLCKKYKALATEVNINGAYNMVHYKPARTRLIYPSTGSVYKPGQAVCDENASVEPLSHYGWTKLEAEKIVLTCENNIVHRYGTAMGCSKNNVRVNLLANDLTLQAVYNKSITIFESSFVRSFIHVEDIAKAIVFTMTNFDKMVVDTNRIYNVTNNKLNFTKWFLCEVIRAKTGCNVTYAEIEKDLDQRNYSMNADKIYAHGYKAEIGLDETLDEIIKLAPILSPFDKYK